MSSYVQYKNVFEGGFKDEKKDPDGTWIYDEVSHSLTRQKIPGTETVGDLDITWYIANAGFDDERKVEMSACGYVKGGKLQQIPELDCNICLDFTSKKNFLRENYKEDYGDK